VVPAVLPFERLAVLYFAAVVAAAAATRRRPHPWRACALALIAIAGIVAVAQTASLVLRASLGHVYLIAAYWIPALLARRTGATRFEQWLTDRHRAWEPCVDLVPRPIAILSEVAYLLCYPLVPAAFVVVWMFGTAADVARFWTTVLLAGFACYASIPWLVSRPPRLVVQGYVAARGIGRVNTFVLDRVSHGLNTFPSGHAAVAMAAAVAVWPVSPAAAIGFGIVAAGVAIGAVTGRHHFILDVVGGAAVGLLAGIAGWIAGAAA
jgi:hypothetical protein